VLLRRLAYDAKFERKLLRQPTFNHSFLTAAGDTNPSLSWSLSQSIGRQAGGSVFASCLLYSIITASDRTEGFYSREKVSFEELNDERQPTRDKKGKLIKIREDDEGEEMSLSMAALTQQNEFDNRMSSTTE
jgi:hypothetical protein